MIDSIGVPYGNRTRVAAVKGRCPRPLDERDASVGCLPFAASALRYRNAFASVKSAAFVDAAFSSAAA
jgi:hypothetical protein